MTETKVDLITGLTFELTADGTAVQESTDSNSVVKEFSDDVEQIAQQVFEAMRFSAGSLQRVNEPQPPEWVPKGNSFMQDHAREVARAILARWSHQPAPLEANGPAVPEGGEPASVALEATEQAQPLWKVMRTAYACSTAPNGSTRDWTGRDGFAAEIRAVAEWLVPEEEPLPDSVHGGNRFDRQAERQRLRALLITEADRAERGDVQ